MAGVFLDQTKEIVYNRGMMFWKYLDAIDHPEKYPFPDVSGDIVLEDWPKMSFEECDKERRRIEDSYSVLMELISTRRGLTPASRFGILTFKRDTDG